MSRGKSNLNPAEVEQIASKLDGRYQAMHDSLTGFRNKTTSLLESELGMANESMKSALLAFSREGERLLGIRREMGSIAKQYAGDMREVSQHAAAAIGGRVRETGLA